MSEQYPTPLEVAETYVTAVRSSDLKLLRSVFADDMEMVGHPSDDLPTGRLRGGDAITAFYGKLLADRGGADPHLGELLVVGNRIAVEIDAHHAEFIDEVADFFTIENGKIQRLAVYSGPRRPK